MLASPSGKIYIGQTTRSIEERFKQHRKKSSGCVAIYNAIQMYGWGNFEKDWYECPDEDLNLYEEMLVALLGTLAPDGYNLKEGGGNRGKYSKQSKQKMRESQLGKTHSEESKQKMRKPKSDDHKQKLSEAHRGEKHPMWGKTLGDDTRQKISEAQCGEKNHKSKRVYQYAPDGTFINSFGSTEEAGRYLGKSGANIRKCAIGVPKYKTAYKFKWSYENSMSSNIEILLSDV